MLLKGKGACSLVADGVGLAVNPFGVGVSIKVRDPDAEVRPNPVDEVLCAGLEVGVVGNEVNSYEKGILLDRDNVSRAAVGVGAGHGARVVEKQYLAVGVFGHEGWSFR